MSETEAAPPAPEAEAEAKPEAKPEGSNKWVLALKIIAAVIIVIVAFQLLTRNSCATPGSILCTVNKGLNEALKFGPFIIIGYIVDGLITTLIGAWAVVKGRGVKGEVEGGGTGTAEKTQEEKTAAERAEESGESGGEVPEVEAAAGNPRHVTFAQDPEVRFFTG